MGHYLATAVSASTVLALNKYAAICIQSIQVFNFLFKVIINIMLKYFYIYVIVIAVQLIAMCRAILYVAPSYSFLFVEDFEFRSFDVVHGTRCIASCYNSYISSVKTWGPLGYWN
jgi:hypothetical protein